MEACPERTRELMVQETNKPLGLVHAFLDLLFLLYQLIYPKLFCLRGEKELA